MRFQTDCRCLYLWFLRSLDLAYYVFLRIIWFLPHFLRVQNEEHKSFSESLLRTLLIFIVLRNTATVDGGHEPSPRLQTVVIVSVGFDGKSM